MTLRSLLPLVLVLGCTPTPDLEIADQELRDGSDGSGFSNQVLKALDTNMGFDGTAFVARYPRCVVSAEHVAMEFVSNGAGDWQSVENAQDRNWQVESTGVPGVYFPIGYKDLQVGWMSASTGSNKLDGYGLSPMDMGTGPLTLGPVDPAIGDPGWVVPTDPSLPLAVAAGWGFTATAPAGTSLQAAAFAVWGHRPGSFAGFNEGGMGMLGTVGTTGTCAGDSGGPVIAASGQVVGVLSGTVTGDCAPPPAQVVSGFHAAAMYTAFDGESGPGGQSNWDWLDSTIEHTCGKWVAVSRDGSGSVSGTVSGPGPATSRTETAVNEEVACNGQFDDDCAEVLHLGDSLELTATPAFDWEFEEWTSGGDPGAPCPCDGETDPTCTLEYGNVGAYTGFISDDSITCEAVFVCPGDEDYDGVPTCDDCDDTDPTVGYIEPEVCDGYDNDCDGDIDEDGDDFGYLDADYDGFGDDATGDWFCVGDDYVLDGGDCDDQDPNIYPGADEYCDGLDNDCDDETDEYEPESPVDGNEYYPDDDGDGYGNDDGEPLIACTNPPGYEFFGGDCDDTNAEISPDAQEVCDSIDNNCDGSIDDLDCGPTEPWAGGNVTLMCGEVEFEMPGDGGIAQLWSPKPAGGISAWSADGVIHWCDWNDGLDAMDWGSLEDSNGDFEFYSDASGPYCWGGWVVTGEECPDY